MKAGIGRMAITPDTQPIRLAGYAIRTTPATGVIHDLWAKALMLEDGDGTRAVLITTDLLGLTREIIATVSARLAAKHGLSRERICFNASHTHSAPIVWPSLPACYDFTPEEMMHVVAQTREMTERIIAAVDQAAADLKPASLSFGRGTAGFAINRRKRATAPVDHEVPVLRIAAPDGTTRAVLFNYACHGTTLTGENLLVNGDYAGFAMLELERAFPGATALYVQGCAGDQNPDPRGTVEHARQHGRELADAVQSVLAKPMKPVNGPLRTAFLETRLVFKPVHLEIFRQELTGDNPYRRRRARLMLEAFNQGNPVVDIPYPVQALRLGRDFAILFLSGEVVVDYALRAKRDHPGTDLLVAGCSSEVQCYIPTARVLDEGGYEPDDSMIYYGQPGPFVPDVEATVCDAIAVALRGIGLAPVSCIA